MASRLPTPGSDDGTWGAILNDYLAQAHKTDGSLKDNIVTTAALAPGAVTASGLADGIITEAKLDSLLQAKVNVGAGGTVADATTTSKGIVQLAGDLGGTATAPTVPGLSGKANTSHTHAASDITSGMLAAVRLGSGTADSTTYLRGDGTWATPVGGGAVSSVAGKTGAVTLAAGDIASGTFATARLGSGTADNTTYLRGDGTWTTVSGSGDASSINGVTVSGTPSSGQVLKATSPTAATWSADSTGAGYTWNFRTITADAAAVDGDYVLADTTSVGITVTLPTVASGAAVRVKRMTGGSNSVQIIPSGGALIDGSGVGSHVLGNQWDSMEFVSDGTNWYRG